MKSTTKQNLRNKVGVSEFNYADFFLLLIFFLFKNAKYYRTMKNESPPNSQTMLSHSLAHTK